PKNVTLSAVDTTKSIPILSWRSAGAVYDYSDFVKAKITSSTNLELTVVYIYTPLAVEWQVVEFTDGASVQTGDVTFGTVDSSKTANPSSVDTSKSWLMFTYQTDRGTDSNIGQKLVRGVITNSTTLTFDRDSTEQAIVLTWYLIEFTDDTSVQGASENFGTGDTQKDVTITSIDSSDSITAAGGYFHHGGKSNFTTDDSPKTGRVTLELTSDTNLRLIRGATGSATADIGWFVITFVSESDLAARGSFLQLRNAANNANILDIASDAPTSSFILDNVGNVGIGRTPTANDLEVEGTASKTAAGDWLANSDIRIKMDVQTIENALGVIDQLRPVKFKYTEEYMAEHPSLEDRYYFNFIAQEFQEIFPDSVQDSGEGYLQLDAYAVRPYLVAAVQELNTKIETLGLEPDNEAGDLEYNLDLEQEVASMSARMNNLETELLLLNSSSLTTDIPEATSSSLLTSLTVLGDSVLGDTVVNGKLNVGILSFDNLTGSIDAIGPLKIQSLALGNIEFMGGLVEIDTSGNVLANEISASKYKVVGASAGKAKISSGEKTVWVETDMVNSNSLVFVTPTTVITHPLVVTEKSEEKGFRVEIVNLENKNIEFNWWIIDKQ
ncbi:tail fiber domain-containing protein, partial [bacterium]|nr:tail fiber domain-containing protein [bacterium]